MRERGDLGGLRRGWRQGPCQGAESTGGFLWPPPSILPRADEEGAGVAHLGSSPHPPHVLFLRNIPPLPESSPLLWALRSAGPDLQEHCPTLADAGKLSPAPGG